MNTNILFTDIVGYSKLTGDDQSLALELLSEHDKIIEPIISKYSGQIVKRIGYDIVAFFENKGGVTAFTYTVPDTNESGNEVAIKVICDAWNKTYSFGDYYSATATFRRVYEA